jgi:hypothetical protein
LTWPTGLSRSLTRLNPNPDPLKLSLLLRHLCRHLLAPVNSGCSGRRDVSQSTHHSMLPLHLCVDLIFLFDSLLVPRPQNPRVLVMKFMHRVVAPPWLLVSWWPPGACASLLLYGFIGVTSALSPERCSGCGYVSIASHVILCSSQAHVTLVSLFLYVLSLSLNFCFAMLNWLPLLSRVLFSVTCLFYWFY